MILIPEYIIDNKHWFYYMGSWWLLFAMPAFVTIYIWHTHTDCIINRLIYYAVAIKWSRSPVADLAINMAFILLLLNLLNKGYTIHVE